MGSQSLSGNDLTGGMVLRPSWFSANVLAGISPWVLMSSSSTGRTLPESLLLNRSWPHMGNRASWADTLLAGAGIPLDWKRGGQHLDFGTGVEVALGVVALAVQRQQSVVDLVEGIGLVAGLPSLANRGIAAPVAAAPGCSVSLSSVRRPRMRSRTNCTRKSAPG